MLAETAKRGGAWAGCYCFDLTIDGRTEPSLSRDLFSSFQLPRHPIPPQAETVVPMSAVAASSEGSRALLALYKRLLRSCATYPSKNRWGIYESIREEFRENMALDPNDPQTREKIGIAYKGLEQLRMYDEAVLGGGTGENPNWSVTLEQNPMPAPPEQK